ncbi:MFS transporter [Paenibacillus sp. N1-5-1-14]|uniref:MFS transporter n=1 Tax=Paenibacillus radicibacter TaxID=2972488 RepID=UPI002158CE8A|nr:MFS transporter [Paenibacillus radicibacter]MCR8643235.1 MFS transporter [Paenibacillus radicibacter]
MRLKQDFHAFITVRGAWLLMITLFLYGIGTGILAPMNAIYMQDSIGLTKIQIVTVFATSLLLNMILTITVGLISDRFASKKPIPIVASILCMIGIGLYMQATSFVPALIGMVLATSPSGMIFGQLFALTRNHFQRLAPQVVEIAQIWMRATYSVGFFTGLLLGANLFLIGSFKAVLWGNISGYAALLILLLFYKEITIRVEHKSATANGEAFSLVMLLALLLLSCADAIRGLYLPLVVHELFGDPKIMSYVWSTQAVFELLFMTMAGYWAAKYGSKPVILLGGGFALITYITYTLSPSLPVVFMMQPLYSLFVSILYGVGMGYVQRMFIHRTGFGSSLYVAISQTASLIGYFLPLVIDGITPTIFAIPGGLVLLSLILMAKVIYTERRTSQSRGTAI